MKAQEFSEAETVAFEAIAAALRQRFPNGAIERAFAQQMVASGIAALVMLDGQVAAAAQLREFVRDLEAEGTHGHG